MNIVIIQECGRHEENKKYRESLCLQRALSKIDGVNAMVWGLNYDSFSTPFSQIENWADVIFLIENYTSGWLPTNEILRSNKLKIFWSIDSHCVLPMHHEMCRQTRPHILLNSTEGYIPTYTGLVDKSYWFPNAYPDELLYKLDVEKKHDIGFCGNYLNRADWVNYLDKYGIKKDIFVIGDSMLNAINSYKIHFNRNIADDINYRTFETTGCGTLLMTNYTPNLEKLFDMENEIVVYNSIGDLDDKVKYLLNNESERVRIETNGMNRAKSEHTYYHRALKLIDIINEN